MVTQVSIKTVDKDEQIQVDLQKVCGIIAKNDKVTIYLKGGKISHCKKDSDTIEKINQFIKKQQQ